MNDVLSVDDKTQHRSVVEYLVTICGLRTDRSARLAAMTILSDLLSSSHVTDATKHICVQSNIVMHLEDILDLSVSARTLDGMEVHLLKLALQIFWELSMGHVCIHETMTNINFLKRIMGMIKFENSPLLKYDKKATKFLKDVCERKHLIAQISDENVKFDSGTVNVVKGDIAAHASLNSSLSFALECRLYDTTGEEDIDICQEFIKNGYALPSKHVTLFNDESWKDILVSSVIFGPFFWAQIGEKVILTCKKIGLMLEKEELKSCVPSVGNHVAVKYSDTFFRCKILNNQGNFLVVMAVDYGMVMTVTEDMIFELPAHLSPLHYKAQAQLCCLSGVSPTLLDRNIQQILIGILSNLTMFNISLGSLLFDLGVFTMLETTLFCPVPCLVIQCLNLTNNLISNPRLTKSIPLEKIRKWLLEICDNLTKQSLSEVLQERTAFWALTCLATLLFKHRNMRNEFYLEEGIDIVLRLISKYRKPSPVYKRAVKVLKNYIITHNGSAKPKKLSPKKNLEENPTDGSSDVNEGSPPILKALDFKEGSIDDETMTTTLNKKEDDRFNFIYEETRSGIHSKYRTIQNSPEYYTHDSTTGLQNNTTVELLTDRSLSSLSSVKLTEVICSMLNTRKGGTIYLGIESNSEVFGLYLNRDERDEFRLSVDRMMNAQLTPSVLHYQFHVKYVPVKKHDRNTGKITLLDDVYVVEIHLENNSETFYCIKDQSFYRFGDQTTLLNLQEVRHIVVLEEEAMFKEEILYLQRQLNALQQQMQIE